MNNDMLFLCSARSNISLPRSLGRVNSHRLVTSVASNLKLYENPSGVGVIDICEITVADLYRWTPPSCVDGMQG